jgi:predicted nucleotidyltransferase
MRYLPIFPEDDGTRFNKLFLTKSHNLLSEILPEYAFLADVLRVIDVSRAADGKVMQVLMNADLDEAVGILTEREEKIGHPETGKALEDGHPESYWRWRRRMAEQVASQLDPVRFGVVGFYLFGSTKNGTAGPASDIDVLVHFKGTEVQREDLRLWLEGWSLCLDEINYLQTGYRSGGLMDVHLVTDEDIAKKTSYAVKIGAVTDAAHPLKMKGSDDQGQPGKETTGPFKRQGVN